MGKGDGGGRTQRPRLHAAAARWPLLSCCLPLLLAAVWLLVSLSPVLAAVACPAAAAPGPATVNPSWDCGPYGDRAGAGVGGLVAMGPSGEGARRGIAPVGDRSLGCARGFLAATRLPRGAASERAKPAPVGDRTLGCLRGFLEAALAPRGSLRAPARGGGPYGAAGADPAGCGYAGTRVGEAANPGPGACPAAAPVEEVEDEAEAPPTQVADLSLGPSQPGRDGSEVRAADEQQSCPWYRAKLSHELRCYECSSVLPPRTNLYRCKVCLLVSCHRCWALDAVKGHLCDGSTRCVRSGAPEGRAAQAVRRPKASPMPGKPRDSAP